MKQLDATYINESEVRVVIDDVGVEQSNVLRTEADRLGLAFDSEWPHYPLRKLTISGEKRRVIGLFLQLVSQKR